MNLTIFVMAYFLRFTTGVKLVCGVMWFFTPVMNIQQSINIILIFEHGWLSL